MGLDNRRDDDSSFSSTMDYDINEAAVKQVGLGGLGTRAGDVPEQRRSSKCSSSGSSESSFTDMDANDPDNVSTGGSSVVATLNDRFSQFGGVAGLNHGANGDGSAGTGTHERAMNEDSNAVVAQLAQRETRDVYRWKIFVIYFIACTAVLVSAGGYLFLQDAEQDQYEQDVRMIPSWLLYPHAASKCGQITLPRLLSHSFHLLCEHRNTVPTSCHDDS
jgi:hypothetical protein